MIRNSRFGANAHIMYPITPASRPAVSVFRIPSLSISELQPNNPINTAVEYIVLGIPLKKDIVSDRPLASNILSLYTEKNAASNANAIP